MNKWMLGLWLSLVLIDFCGMLIAAYEHNRVDFFYAGLGFVGSLFLTASYAVKIWLK